MNFKTISILILQLLLLLIFSCKKEEEKNQEPQLNISYATNGLKVILSGSAIDSDGSIKELRIDWGDSSTIEILDNRFAAIDESHKYNAQGTYKIIISVSDNEGSNGSQTLTIPIDFNADIIAKNIKQSMLKANDNEYLILTINLHTYQETDADHKLAMLAELIGKMDIDFIALQECAQHKSSAIVSGIIRQNNMAYIVSNDLKENYSVDYNFVWHWAHYGWSVFEEGVSIMSKHPLIDSQDRYISTIQDINNIKSRKVIYGSYQIPEGRFNMFSAHTHWRLSTGDQEQNQQMENIQSMVDEKELLAQISATFVCGDFNCNPTSNYPWSEGYTTMINNGEYSDSFLDIYPSANNKPAQSIYNTIGGSNPGRIDYIFKKNNTIFNVIDSQIIFTDDVAGQISDHYGVITKISIL